MSNWIKNTLENFGGSKSIWINLLLLIIKWVCLVILILVAYYAFIGFTETPSNPDWIPGETFPY